MCGDRECLEFLRRISDGHISTVRLELWDRIRIDSNYFTGGANAEDNGDVVGAVGIYLDIVLLVFLKARLVDGYGVRVGNKVVDAELATFIGVYRNGSSFGGVGDHDRRIRDQRTRGIRYCSVDSSVNSLSECVTG